MEYREVNENEQEKWDELATHPLQSWAWGEFRRRRQEVNRLGVYDGEKLIRGYQIIWSRLYFLPMKIGYVPMGSIPTVEDINKLKSLSKQKKALLIRTEPNVRKDQATKTQVSILESLKTGRPLFKPKTFWWDLTKPDEELLKNMHPKARYNIKVAQKHGVIVKEETGEEAINKFVDLLFNQTANRQGFYAHNANYHKQMYEVLNQAGIGKIFTANYQGQAISAWFVMTWNDTVYYVYGANSLEHREVMAPTLLMWELARWGKTAGYKKLDMWGAEEGKGFSRYKQQFGAELVEMVGTFDIPVNKLVYPLFRLAEEMRWKILRMLK